MQPKVARWEQVSMLCLTAILLLAHPSRAGKIGLPEKELAVVGGSFVFSDLAIQADWSDTVILLATVTNRSSHTWLYAKFGITFIGSDGQKAETTAGVVAPYVVGKLSPGANESRINFGTNYRIRGDARRIIGCEIAFVEGTQGATYKIEMISPVRSKNLAYGGTAIDFVFSMGQSSIGVALSNKTRQAVTVDWNRISYVGPSGQAQKVMHSGIRYAARTEHQEPTVIPPHSEISDYLTPVDNVYFGGGDWKEREMFPLDLGKAAPLNGTTFRIFLPLRIGNVEKNYNFEFRVSVD